MQSSYHIDFYETLSGKVPAEEDLAAIKDISDNLHTRLLANIEKLGNRAYHKPPVSEHLEPGILYVRAKAGHFWGRMFYTFGPYHQILLLCGFSKTTDKLPPNEIERARTLLNERNRRRP